MTVNNKLERMGKEAVMAYFKVLSWHSLGGIDENNTSVRIVVVRAESRTWHHLNESLKCYGFRQLSYAPVKDKWEDF
jgi:hypothetical protein